MNIINDIENEYRSSKNYGVTFSIEPSAYECRLGDRVSFGENITDLSCGTFYNSQDILLDGKPIGYLIESQSGKLLHPMCVSFAVPLADCSEENLWEEMTDKYKDDPHLVDNIEILELRFATLNQMIDFLGL